MYYRDPDGNQLETQVDNFDEPEDATNMMDSKEFMENPLGTHNQSGRPHTSTLTHTFLGTDFDPEELCAAVERGENDAMLKTRTEVGPRGPEDIPKIYASINSAPVGA